MNDGLQFASNKCLVCKSNSFAQCFYESLKTIHLELFVVGGTKIGKLTGNIVFKCKLLNINYLFIH